MSAWQIFGWASVCVGGAIAFLTIVANEIRRISAELEGVESRERSRFQQRMDAVVLGGPSPDEQEVVEEAADIEVVS